MRLLWMLSLSLVILATDAENPETPKPCRLQQMGKQLRCAVPSGYSVRSGDCSGNDIWALYRDRTTLKECARLCSSSPSCQAFMFYNNHRCYPKTKTCATTTKTNPRNVFYDKVPSGYAMRAGDCHGNDIWALYRNSVTRQKCAQLCDSDSTCNAFMHYNNHRCYPKSTGCGVTSLSNSLNIFYDKVPTGYALRASECSARDIWRSGGLISLTECANKCSTDDACTSFMYYYGKECYLKTRICAEPNTASPRIVFYDKVPSGYAMRPGDCSGNDIWSIHGFVSLAECARRCNNYPGCVAFMFYDGRECYPKTKTCQTTDTGNPKNFFYDKIATTV